MESLPQTLKFLIETLSAGLVPLLAVFLRVISAMLWHLFVLLGCIRSFRSFDVFSIPCAWLELAAFLHAAPVNYALTKPKFALPQLLRIELVVLSVGS